MKKVFLFLAAALLSLSMQAKVGLIIPADNRSTAETNAATWFASTYTSGTGEAITLADNMDLSGYSTIWVMVDRVGLAQGEGNLPITATQKSLLEAYVKAGGNLMLTNQATQLVNSIGRCTYAPGIYGSGDGGQNSDVWGIQAVIGNVGGQIYDHRSHAIYSELSSGDYIYDHPIFPLIGNCHKMDHNCMWDLNSYGLALEPNVVKKFEDLTQSVVLGTWQHVTDYCCAGIVEFQPTGAYLGTILANGMAAYDWQATRETDNMIKLTSNTLSYLESLRPKVPNPAAETAFLLLANTVEELPSVPEKNAANEFAKTYFTTDVATSEGRYISLSDLSNIPSSVKNIIVHADRESLANWSNVNGVNVTNLLQTWVKTKGGNLVLLRQATVLASDMHRIDYAPHCQPLSNSASGENEPEKNQHDKIRVKMGIEHINDCSSYSPCYVDRSGDGLFDGMTIQEDGDNKLITLNNGGPAKNRCYWQSMRYDGTNDATYYRAQFDAFETRYNCQVLAVEGYVLDFCLASIIRFKKGTVPADGGANWKGTILAIGAGGFQYTDGNTAKFDVLNTLIRNAVESIQPTPCDNCFLITL